MSTPTELDERNKILEERDKESIEFIHKMNALNQFVIVEYKKQIVEKDKQILEKDEKIQKLEKQIIHDREMLVMAVNLMRDRMIKQQEKTQEKTQDKNEEKNQEEKLEEKLKEKLKEKDKEYKKLEERLKNEVDAIYFMAVSITRNKMEEKIEDLKMELKTRECVADSQICHISQLLRQIYVLENKNEQLTQKHPANKIYCEECLNDHSNCTC